VIYGVSSSHHSYLLCKPITWQLVRSLWPLYADRFLHNWDLDRSIYCIAISQMPSCSDICVKHPTSVI
jgi:hypothetical protein